MIKKPKVCAVLRAYAHKSEQVKGLCEQIAQAALALRGKVDHIRILVWENDQYPDADCGLSFGALKRHFGDDATVSIRSASGDIFVGVFSGQLLPLLREGYDYIVVLSSTSHALLTDKVMARAREEMMKSVLAISVVQEENPLTREGAISNTCAFWHLLSLVEVGGFHGIDMRPPDFDYEVHHQGVGEIAVLFTFQEVHKIERPLVVIEPDVQVVDVRTAVADPKQLLKLKHKERRIKMVLAMLGCTMADLQNLIAKRIQA